MPQHRNLTGACSNQCGRQRRPGQRTCKECHADYMTRYRAEQADRQAAQMRRTVEMAYRAAQQGRPLQDVFVSLGIAESVAA
jgi:hypothetical protein